MRFSFSYSFSLDFSSPIKNHAFALKVSPMQDEFRRLENYVIFPNNLAVCTDGLGNTVHFGHIDEQHERFELRSQGVLRVKKGDVAACTTDCGIFTRMIGYTPYSVELEALNASLPSGIGAEYLCQYIFDNFSYQKGYSDHASDIREILRHGKGVCQDFSHLMIALLRLRGVPARYVSGYIEGDGETHAWVECVNGAIWEGWDPTHGKKVVYDEPYIKVAHGRDFDDTSVNRGVFSGSAMQKISVNVKVGRV